MIKKIVEGDLASGKGPVLSYGPGTNNLLKFIIEQAEKNKIPFQRLMLQEVREQIQMLLLIQTWVLPQL